MDFDYCQICGDNFFIEDLIKVNNKNVCKKCNNIHLYSLK